MDALRKLVFTACAVVTAVTMSASALGGEAFDRIMSRGELVLGTAGTMPPLNMTTKDGRVIGMEPQLAGAMARAMGVKLRIETMPFDQLLPALTSGKVDIVMSGMTITPQRNLTVAFVGPYLVSGKCFLTKIPEIGAAESPQEIDDDNLTLAALRGSTSEAFVRAALPDAELVATADYDQGVKLVLEDKVQAMVADYPLCAVSLVRYPDAGLVSLFTVLTYEPIGVAVPADDAHLVNWTQNFLATLDASGQLDELKAAWFEDGSWLKELP